MDLQSYLNDYETKHPENFLHVEQKIDCRYIATTLVAKLEKQNRFPILILDCVVNILGQESPYPVVTNLLSSRSRCAEIIGSTYENVGYAFYQGMSEKRLKPVIVHREEAPVKEVSVTGDQVNLFELPALMHHATDPGTYITAGYFTCYNPETGVDNSTLHRCWIKDKRELRVYLGRHQHARLNLTKHEQEGRDMKAAVWIGHHPAAMLGCETKQGYSESHYEAAGGFLGAPLRLVPSETLGEDFLVPADAEFVIEGIMKANCLVPEGPFGEATGHIGPQVQMPYMDVTAVTHRTKAYWVDFQAGYAENRLMLGLPVEGGINELLRRKIPSFLNVYVPTSGISYQAYLQLKNPLKGEAREAIILALMSSNQIKHVFAFDEDVDIFDEKEVLWAIATRSRWDDDVIILQNTRGTTIDPMGENGLITKGGIDCTKPSGEAFPNRNAIPSDIFHTIRLNEVFSIGKLSALPDERV